MEANEYHREEVIKFLTENFPEGEFVVKKDLSVHLINSRTISSLNIKTRGTYTHDLIKKYILTKDNTWLVLNSQNPIFSEPIKKLLEFRKNFVWQKR